MEFGECIYDFDVIDVAERSPLHNQHLEGEEGNLKTSKSWCGPLNQLIGIYLYYCVQNIIGIEIERSKIHFIVFEHLHFSWDSILKNSF